MANIWNADFTGVTVANDPNGTFGTHQGTLVGSVTMDYDSSTAASLDGLTFTDKTTLGLPGIPGQTVTFTTFALTPATVNGQPGWQLTSADTLAQGTIQLTMTWQDTTPSQLSSAVIVGTGGQVYDTLSPSTNDVTWTGVCFVEGTLIRKPRGDVPVETLTVGDLVVTGSGEWRPVKWLGRRKVKCRAHPGPRSLFPVRIARDAFGPNRPSQDLLLSSGHSVCIDLCGEVLIPVGNLVNGATIAEVEMDEVSYWHVELDSHDILIANNLPSESYLAMSNRGFFEEAGATLDAVDQGYGRTYADFCRPVVTEGPVLSFVRQRLLERAEAIGWTPSRETDLRLMVDGEVHRPVEEGDAAAFRLPASARDVRLLSNTFIPALVGVSGDPRELGVSLTGLSFSDDNGEPRPVPLDDERLKDGLHPGEGKDGLAWRWTKGELFLNRNFWDGLSGDIILTIRLGNPPVRRWIAPVRAETEIPSDSSAPRQMQVA